MLATVDATDSASTVIKKYSVFIYSKAEPRAMYAIYKQTLTLCVLQYTIYRCNPNNKRTPKISEGCQIGIMEWVHSVLGLSLI